METNLLFTFLALVQAAGLGAVVYLVRMRLGLFKRHLRKLTVNEHTKLTYVRGSRGSYVVSVYPEYVPLPDGTYRLVVRDYFEHSVLFQTDTDAKFTPSATPDYIKTEVYASLYRLLQQRAKPGSHLTVLWAAPSESGE